MKQLVSASAADFKNFAVEQLKSGAGALHEWVNRDNTRFKDVTLYDHSVVSDDPDDALKAKAQI